MMRKGLSIVLVIAMSIVTIVYMTGCGKSKIEDKTPMALSIVNGGAHMHFPKITAENTDLFDMIYQACISYGNVSIVIDDGNPSVKSNYDILKVDKDITDTKKKTIASQNASTIFSECVNTKALCPEVDTLEAIKVSADILRAKSPDRKIMYVYDSGVCTTGLISQLEGDVISTDHEIVVKELEEIHAMPDLSGIEVQWFGLGCVAGEQDDLPSSYKYKLEALWTKIIKAAGGSVTFDPTPISGEENENLPEVSKVSFVQDCLDLDFTSAKVLSEPIVFNENTVKFLGDKAEFIDRDAAIEVLRPVGEILRDNPDVHIIIAGTTASAGTEQGCLDLSMKRAEACKDILLEYGAKEEQMECVGLGRAENCFRVNDLNSDGTLNEEMAKLNRAIYIFTTESEIAETIL